MNSPDELITALEKIENPVVLQFLSDELGLDKASLKEEMRLWLSRIEGNQKRQLRLINDLLDLAKMESGKMDFQFRKGDFRTVLDEVLKELEMLLQEKKISVHVSGSDIDTTVWIDPARMSQVVRNLFSNAMKFTPNGKCIFVVFETDKIKKRKALSMSVRDYGEGIPEDELQLVFDKFAQSSNHVSGGTGLGLPICREIVSAHGGKISANNHDDGGAVFTVVLPKKPEEK